MKKVYGSVRSLLSTGASLLLGWFGFSGCLIIGGAEYGTPTVNYEFKVHVRDQNAKPVPGLQVSVSETYYQEKPLTDADGNVQLNGRYTGFYGDQKVGFGIRDVDGERNGVVTDTLINVDVKESDFVSKGRGWNKGKIVKDITLEVKRK